MVFRPVTSAKGVVLVRSYGNAYAADPLWTRLEKCCLTHICSHTSACTYVRTKSRVRAVEHWKAFSYACLSDSSIKQPQAVSKNGNAVFEGVCIRSFPTLLLLVVPCNFVSLFRRRAFFLPRSCIIQSCVCVLCPLCSGFGLCGNDSTACRLRTAIALF